MRKSEARSGQAARSRNVQGVSRRDFLKSTAIAAAAALVPGSSAGANSSFANGPTSERLVAGWEFFRGSLGGVWDVWRTDMAESTVWQKVEIPHCFNARDAVDPDVSYYEGPCWYRRKLQLRNPFEHGRTLLLFEAAGQKCEIFVAYEQVAAHIGGYDEFTVDITEAAARALKPAPSGEEIGLAVLCNNSRDREMIPSAMNDFDRVGGLYRSVTLAYLPAVSIERVHIDVGVSTAAAAEIRVKARLRNPSQFHDELQLLVRLFDPKGVVIRTAGKRVPAWQGEQEVSTFHLESPELWSPSHPSLYRCEVQIASAYGQMSAVERFGCRWFEFVDHGPFKLNGEPLF